MKTVFFSEYIKNVRTVGAILPSTRYLAKKMIAHVSFSTANVIVEYGPGTGVFTEAILQRKHDSTVLIVIEQNKAFFDILCQRYAHYENVFIEHDSAENIKKILKKHGQKQADYIISGLPFAALPAAVSDAILHSTVHVLTKQGSFVTFQYTMLKKNFMHGFFKHINVTREYRNIPPAYIFLCTNE